MHEFTKKQLNGREEQLDIWKKIFQEKEHELLYYPNENQIQ